MRRMPFQRPTDYYNERLLPIDEQLCALIKQRKEISSNNPGYPPFEVIEEWAGKYGFYEDFLKSLFGSLRNEDHFRPRIEPEGFRRHVPVLRTVEQDEKMFTVTFLRQYENASVVHLQIDWDPQHDVIDQPPRSPQRHHFLQLSVGEGYECHNRGGGGSQGNYRHEFVVSPPLPDDVTGIRFVFREFDRPFGEPTGRDIEM